MYTFLYCRNKAFRGLALGFRGFDGWFRISASAEESIYPIHLAAQQGDVTLIESLGGNPASHRPGRFGVGFVCFFQRKC